MSFFDNGDPEELFLFVRNFNVTLADSGTLDTGANIQYLRTLVRGEELRHFDLLSADVDIPENLNVEYIIKGLELYFYLVHLLSKQKNAMRHGMKKPRGLKVRQYMARLIDLNEYLDSFHGANLSDKLGIT